MFYTRFYTQVTYLSDCPNGGSTFSAVIKKKEHMEIGLFLRSHARACDAPQNMLSIKKREAEHVL